MFPLESTIGRLPTLWNRRVIFFANLHSLFFGNAAETQRLSRGIRGIDTYGGRMIAILGILFRQRPNVLVLEAEPDVHLTRFLASRLGIDIPEICVLNGKCRSGMAAPGGLSAELQEELGFLGTRSPEWIDGFVTDRKIAAIARLVGKRTVTTPRASKTANNKLELFRFLEARGMPVFDTIETASAARIGAALEILRSRGYRRAVIKAQIGASGYGMRRVDLTRRRRVVVEDFYFHEGACLVQGWLDETVRGVEKVGSPSLQFFIRDDGASFYDLTEQLLNDDCVHEGNCAPPPYAPAGSEIMTEILLQGAAVAQFLFMEGYRGIGSIDFLVVRRAGSVRVYVCEVNARVTGATYPAILARHFQPGSAWMMRNVRLAESRTGESLLAALEKSDALFDSSRGEGVIPINFNRTRTGIVEKGQFLALGESVATAARWLGTASKAFGGDWKFDRD